MWNLLPMLNAPDNLLATTSAVHLIANSIQTVFALIGLSIFNAQIWHAVPLVVVVSLVYGATRHEHLPEIVMHSIRSIIWVTGFMAIIFAMIWLAGFWN